MKSTNIFHPPGSVVVHFGVGPAEVEGAQSELVGVHDPTRSVQELRDRRHHELLPQEDHHVSFVETM